MSNPPPPPADCCRLPWRSAAVGWLTAAAVLAVGLPLFLRMPIWIDVTLYDLAARAVLRGGVHYRDVFDTNPPGFVWAMCLVRAVLGKSPEAVRVVDAAVVAGVTAVLLRWARAGGATRGGVAWAAAGVVTFYLFQSEFVHCQRDVWLLLPAAVAAWFRVRRVLAAHEQSRDNRWVFRTAVLEGSIWGIAAWVKPHVILVAVAAWAAVQLRLAGSAVGGRWAGVWRSLADLGGSLAGGLLVGGLGLAWLVWTGTLPYMLDVFTNWNPSYLQTVFEVFEDRKEWQLKYFPPWSLLFAAAAPLAVLNLIDARLWARRDTSARGPVGWVLPALLFDRRADARARFARGVLAVVYLAWAAVTFALQKHFHYAHVPEVFLMLAVFAANRWAVVVPVILFQMGIIAYTTAGHSLPQPRDKFADLVYRHTVWTPPTHRFDWWSRCFDRDVSPELREGVSFQSHTYAGIRWTELDEVAAFLRSQGVREGDDSVLCWNDSPHALYLVMDLRPPIRFMHLSTAMDIMPIGYDTVLRETTAAVDGSRKVRFVVSDMQRVFHFFPPAAKARMGEPGPGPDLLPPVVPQRCRTVFPLNQPTVFRSGHGRGRYVVHAVTNHPIGDVYVALWPEGMAVPE